MKKLVLFLTVLLMLPVPAFAGWTLTEMKQVNPTESATNGQQCCIRWRLTGTAGGAAGAATVTVRRSANAVFAESDLLITSWTDPNLTLPSGGWVEFNTCNKFCQDNKPQGNFHLCVEVEYAGETIPVCSKTKKTCIHSNNTGSTPGDDKSSGDDIDPISTFTGAFFKHFPIELDLGGPMPLLFYRYYTSDYVKTTRHASALGTNWRHNFDWHLQKIGDNRVEVTDNEGRLITFTSVDSGLNWTLSDPLDIPYQLVNGAANEYVLGHPLNNRTYTFFVDPSQFFATPGGVPVYHGGLTFVKDAHGNSHSFSHTDNQLITVADGLGRTLTFTYDNSRMLSSVAGDQGRSIEFTHGGSNLRELLTSKDSLLNVTTYSYDSTHALPGLMTGYQRPKGNTARTQTYEAGTGRVLTQTAMSNTNSLAYVGNLTTVTDPATKTLKHTHSGTGELTRIENKSGDTSELTYDGSYKRRKDVTDSLGATTGYTYHTASGRPASITHANGQSTGFAYTVRAVGSITQYDRTMITHTDGSTNLASFDASGNLISRTDQAGQITSYTYNGKGQVLTATNPAAAITTWTYNADGTLATHKDAFNNTTSYGYDSLRRRNLITYADGTTHSFVYDVNDRITSSIDPRNNTTTYTYDGNNNVTTVIDRAGNVTTFTYDALDRVIDIEDTSTVGKPSHVTTFDSLERLKNITDRNGNKTAFTYDVDNRLTRATDPLLKQWHLAYNDEGILAGTTDPLGHSNTVTSDPMGRITGVKTALGNNTSTVYDSMGRETTITDPLGKTNIWSYDARGLLSTWSMPGPVSAAYTRNKLGQITRVTDADGQFWGRAYNKGRLVSRTDPLGRITSYAYDKMNRISVTTFPNALGTLTNTYDGNDNPIRRQYSGPGPDLSYTYDAMDRMLAANGLVLVRDSLGRITRSNGIDASYDSGGRLTSVDMDSGGSTRTVSYTYDANDRLTAVTDWLAGTTTFTYDNAGRLLTLVRPNAVVSTYTYNNDDKLLSITENKGGTLSSHTLMRDAAGQVASATRNVVAGPTWVESDTLRVFDAAAQIQGHSYDALGRLTNNNTGTTRSWDSASRMTGSNHNGAITTYTYDGLGQRLSKVVGGGDSRSYVWNKALKLPSVGIEKDSGADLRYYVHTPSGGLLHSIDASNSDRHFYHYDENGNTRFVSDGAGSIEVSYHHSPYGVLLGKTGNLDNPFTWQGMWGVMDDGGGQFYARARYYDAASKRFISKDPVVSIAPKKINPYQYAAGNPLMFGDATGLSGHDTGVTVDDVLGTVSGVTGGIANTVSAYSSPTKVGVVAVAYVGNAVTGADLVSDDTTIGYVSDALTVVSAGQVVATGITTGGAAAGMGSVGAAAAGPITVLVATTAWTLNKVVLLGEGVSDLLDADEGVYESAAQVKHAELRTATNKKRIEREENLDNTLAGIAADRQASDDSLRAENEAGANSDDNELRDLAMGLGDALISGESSNRRHKPPSNN